MEHLTCAIPKIFTKINLTTIFGSAQEIFQVSLRVKLFLHRAPNHLFVSGYLKQRPGLAREPRVGLFRVQPPLAGRPLRQLGRPFLRLKRRTPAEVIIVCSEILALLST